MATRRSRRKQREHILEILIMITFIAMGSVIILGLSHVYMNWKISRNQRSIEALSNRVTTLQEEIDLAKEKEKECQEKLDQLQARFSKYQELIIPESMQED